MSARAAKKLTEEEIKVRRLKNKAKKERRKARRAAARPPPRQVEVFRQAKQPAKAIAKVGGDQLISRLMSPGQKNSMIAWMKSLMTGNPTDQHSLIPRQVPAKVSPSPIVQPLVLPYVPYGQGTDPRQGVAGLEVYRSLACPLRVWTVEQAGAITHVVRVFGQTPYSGFWADNNSYYNDGQLNGVLEIDDQDPLNVVGLIENGDNYGGYGQFSRRFVCAANGSNCWGFPVDFTGLTNITVPFKLHGAEYHTNGFQLQMRLLSATAATAWVDASDAVSDATTLLYESSVTFTGGVATLGGAFSCCLPDKPLAIQIRSKDSKRAYCIASKFTVTTHATSRLGWLKPMPLDDLTSYDWVQTSNFTNLRGWLEYVGSNLQNAGVVSANTCPGGAPPSILGFTGYSSVAATVNAYNDAIKNGAWSWWKPQKMEDFDMLPKDDALAAAMRTSFVIWAKLGSPAEGNGQADALKFELRGNIEATTRDQTRPLMEAEANPVALTWALSILYHMPAHMENPLHWRDIGNFLSKVKNVAFAGARFVEANKDWLVPAAMTVAKAAGAAAVLL